MTPFPKSLYGRLLLVLLIGLMVPQLLSALVHLYDRDTLLHQTMGLDSAEKISSMVELLDSVAPEQRQTMVDLLSGYPLEIVLNPTQEKRVHAGESPDDDANEQLVLLFKKYLQRRLPAGYEAHVAVVESIRMAELMTQLQPPPQMRMMHERMRGRIGDQLRVKSFHVQVRLNDGSWLDFHYFLPKRIFA
jgi:hypothetical protein